MLCSDAVKLGCCVDAVTTEMLAESIIQHIRKCLLMSRKRMLISVHKESMLVVEKYQRQQSV